MSSAGVITALISMVSTVLARILAGLTALMSAVRGGSSLPRAGDGCSPSSSVCSKAVLVTNCDDAHGFGRALALRLDRRGFLVFAACGSEHVATQIRQAASPSMRPLVLDAMNAESVQRAVDFVKQSMQPSTVLWAIVNTPGASNVAGLPSEAHTVAGEYQPLFESNVFGMAAVTAAFMPALMAGKGRVVNTGCVTGLMAIPNNISYVAMESAVVAWSEALRREKATFGVTVSTIIPGAFHTSSTDMESVWSELRRKWRNVPDEIKLHYDVKYLENAGVATWKSLKSMSKDLDPVVDAYEHALFASRPRRVYHVGRDARVVATLCCLPRSWQDFLLPFFFLYPHSTTKYRYEDVTCELTS